MPRCIRFSACAIFACAFLALSAHGALAQRASGPVIYVLGGPTAVSQETVARLEQLTGGEVSRLSGNDRYATAAAVSRAHFTSAPTVLVASGESYADALSAGPAATARGGPILLVTRGGIPLATDQELERLAPGRVVIAGGASAVSRTVEAQLAARGVMVERVSGPDRYATSAALSRVAAPHGAKTVFLTSGRDFADAMSGAAPAAVHGATILLTDPRGITAAVRAELLRLAPREIVVLGGETAVPTRLADRLRAETGIPYRRVAGSDRFVTNAQVSRTFYPRGADVIFLANAGRFADAMVVGAVARGGEAAAHAAPQAHEAGHDSVDGVLLYTHDVPPGGERGDTQLPPMLEQELGRLAQEHREHRRPEPEKTDPPKPVETKTPAPPAPPAPAPPAPPVTSTPPSLDLNGVDAGEDTVAAFTEDGPPALVAPGAKVSDADSTSLTGAKFTLSNRPDGAAEMLGATAALPAGISAAAYDAATGILSLSGNATVADYEAAVRLIGYTNTDDTPDLTARSISVTVSDVAGASTARTSAVSLTASNDPPALDLNGAGTAGNDHTASFTEDGGAVALAPAAALSDADSANLTGATITLSNDLDGNAETLAGVSANGVTVAAYDGTDGTLELTGSASVAAYQEAIRSVTYASTSQTPNTTARSVTITVTDGTATSISRTVTVSVTAVNDTPALGLDTTAGSDVSRSFVSGGSAVAIAPLAVATDDDGVVSGATITIASGRADGNDETLDLPGTVAGITESWDLATGVLTLSGSAAPATYQTALRAVTYHHADPTPAAGARGVTVTLTDGTATTAARTSTVTVTANTAPVAANHTYSDEPVFVNVLFVSGGGSPAAEARTAHTLKLLDSATDAQNDTLTVTDLDITTGQGAVAILDPATGAFSYEPTTSGQHVLTYEISDGTLTDTGTVTIDVDTDKVVFVKSGAAGTGTSTSPAGTLTAAQTAAGAGDTIFVSVGDGTAYIGGIALESGQRLIGRPSGLTLSHSGGSVNVVTAGNSAKPVIGNAAGAAITMADGATVDGIAVTQTTQAGITGGAGTATIRNVAITTTTANGIDLATGTYTLDGGVTVSTGTGTALRQASGTISVSGAGNTLSASGGPALNLSGTAETGGMVLESVSTNGGANGIVFSPANVNDPDASLTVQGVSAATSGGTLQNHTGDAIVATAGSVTLNKMLIQSNAGRAVSATGTRGLTLHTVQVTGNGDTADEHSVQLTNITGGNTIEASTFQEGSGDLLRLSNTNKNATLTVANSTFQDTNAAGGAGGLAIYGDGTSAITASITGSTFTSFGGSGVRFATGTVSGGNGSSSLTFKDNTLTGSAGRPTHLEILPKGQTTVTATVGGPGANDGNTFDTLAEAEAGAVHIWADDLAQLRGTIQGNTIDDSQGYGILVFTAGGNPTRVLVRDNTVSDPSAEGIWVGNSDSASANGLDATILNNAVSGAGDLAEPEPVAAIRFEAFDDVVCSDIAGNSFSVPENSNADITIDTQGTTTHTYVMTDSAPVTNAKVSARNGGASVVILNTAPGVHGSGACLQP